MVQLHRRLTLSAPFVSENGGGIFFPGETLGELLEKAVLDKGLWKWSLGLPYGRLVKEIREIRKELGWHIRGFSDMSTEEISRLTGLDRETAELAAQREYDEPFIIVEGQGVDKSALVKSAAKRGLAISRGGRFYHLHGKNDKGHAMGKILSWYRRFHGEVVSVALGDSPNDFPMLRLADHSILVRSEDDFPRLKEEIPHLSFACRPGPEGWNSAVIKILEGEDA
jgi:mannosyl-3-phosphoglycerate phosphatase